jgi:hypothetical protein
MLLLPNGTTMKVNDAILRKRMSQTDRDLAVMRLGQKLMRGVWLMPVFCEGKGLVLIDSRESEKINGDLYGRPVNANKMLCDFIGTHQRVKVYGDALFVPEELLQNELYEKFARSIHKAVQYNTCAPDGAHKQGREHTGKRKRPH